MKVNLLTIYKVGFGFHSEVCSNSKQSNYKYYHDLKSGNKIL